MDNTFSGTNGLIFDEIPTNERLACEVESTMRNLPGYDYSIFSEADGKGQIRDFVRISLDQIKIENGMTVPVVNEVNFQKIMNDSALKELGLCEVFTEAMTEEHLVVNALLRLERYSV